jgi:hypothetical protein
MTRGRSLTWSGSSAARIGAPAGRSSPGFDTMLRVRSPGPGRAETWSPVTPTAPPLRGPAGVLGLPIDTRSISQYAATRSSVGLSHHWACRRSQSVQLGRPNTHRTAHGSGPWAVLWPAEAYRKRRHPLTGAYVLVTWIDRADGPVCAVRLAPRSVDAAVRSQILTAPGSTRNTVLAMTRAAPGDRSASTLSRMSDGQGLCALNVCCTPSKPLAARAVIDARTAGSPDIRKSKLVARGLGTFGCFRVTSMRRAITWRMTPHPGNARLNLGYRMVPSSYRGGSHDYGSRGNDRGCHVRGH